VPPSAPIQPGDLCGGATYDFYMSETPASAPSEPSAGAFARLEAARVHYARAVELDPGDLWVRLGYAYTLDRLGRTNAARAQLRSLLHRGTQNLVGAPVSYEQTAVLQEADARLRHLATSTADRRLLRRMRYRLEHADVIPLPMSPIVVPLIDAPFAALIDTSSPVAWDFTGQGDTRAQGWLGGDAAWLVWDPNQRADIRSGFDMIGQRTWGVFWSDGFEALRALDDNSDGELTGAELGGLSLWRDADGDGVSDAGEVLPASAHGVAALSVRGDATRPGLMTAPAGVRFKNGQTRPLYDWSPGLDHAPVSLDGGDRHPLYPRNPRAASRKNQRLAGKTMRFNPTASERV
jgi:hypothetical protein